MEEGSMLITTCAEPYDLQPISVQELREAKAVLFGKQENTILNFILLHKLEMLGLIADVDYAATPNTIQCKVDVRWFHLLQLILLWEADSYEIEVFREFLDKCGKNRSIEFFNECLAATKPKPIAVIP